MPGASSTTRTPTRTTTSKPAQPKKEVVEDTAQPEEPVEAENTILIHFVRDGATAFGSVWYAGQEVEIERDSEAFRATIDRSGNSWLDRSEEDRLEKGPLAWKIGPSDIKNELIDYPQNFDPHGMTYHKGEWLDLTMLRLRAEKEVSRGRSIPNN